LKLFYTGPLVNAELLVMMLENHGIPATQEFATATVPEGEDADDLSRPTKVLVAEGDYDRAHRLIFTEREDEL
jgi:Putative prokaryotic signal transducing protein